MANSAQPLSLKGITIVEPSTSNSGSPSGKVGAKRNWDKLRQNVVRTEPSPTRDQFPLGSSHTSPTKTGLGNLSPWDANFQKILRNKTSKRSETQQFRDEINRIAFIRTQTSSDKSFTLHKKGNRNALKGFNPPNFDLPSTNEPFPFLNQLRITLGKFRQFNTLPDAAIVLSELSTPFRSTEPDAQACALAIDIFTQLTETYKVNGPDEELSRWKWCCEGLNVNVVPARVSFLSFTFTVALTISEQKSRLLRLLLTLITPTANARSAYAPDTPLAFRSFTASLIQALFQIENSLDPNSTSAESEEIRAQIKILKNLLNRLSLGQIIRLEGILSGQSELSKEYIPHRNQGNLTLESLAKVVYLEGLVRITMTSLPDLSSYVFVHLLEVRSFKL